MSTHGLFVAAAYGVAGVGVAGLVLWIVVDGLLRQKEIRALEEGGMRRRAASRPAAAGPQEAKRG